MPNCRNFRHLVLVWLMRAWRLRRCQWAISSAACCSSGFRAAPSSQYDWTRAAAARWTWQTVSSEFFPPQILDNLGQEVIADGTERQVALQPPPASSFVMVQSHLSFVVFEEPFDVSFGASKPATDRRFKPSQCVLGMKSDHAPVFAGSQAFAGEFSGAVASSGLGLRRFCAFDPVGALAGFESSDAASGDEAALAAAWFLSR